MIPLRDDTRRERLPLLNWLFIAINLAVFLHELSLGDEIRSFVEAWGLVPRNVTREIAKQGFSVKAHLAPWITSLFIHGGWLHFLGNMWFLHVFGDNVEDRLGRARYLVLFLSGGLLAGLAQVAAAPSDATPIVGASGAISAVIGAYLVLYPRARILTLLPIFVLFYFVQLPAFLFIGLWFLIQIFYGYLALVEAAHGGVAWWAHVGGFGAGILLALVLKVGTVARPRRELKPGRLRLLGRDKGGTA